MLIVDIDPQHGGENSLAALVSQHGQLPDTLQARTPSGGRHLYFNIPLDVPMLGNTTGKLGPGIDTRGAGGNAIAPPSVVAGRQYRWRNRQKGAWIHPAPAWLIALLDADDGNRAASPQEWLDLAISGVDEGQRNTVIARLAGKLLRYLPAKDALFAAELLACWNQVRCRPPLTHAELATILNSIATAEMQRRQL